MKHTRTAGAAVVLVAAVLAGCSSTTGTSHRHQAEAGPASKPSRPAPASPSPSLRASDADDDDASDADAGDFLNEMEGAMGMPPAPTGQKRADYLAALRSISPELAISENKAVYMGREQCGGFKAEREREKKGEPPANMDAAAQDRFDYSRHTVTRADARKINAMLQRLLCPPSA